MSDFKIKLNFFLTLCFLVTLAGCLSTPTKIESSFKDKNLTKPYSSILVYTVEIDKSKVTGSKNLIRSSQRKMNNVDTFLVENLNSAGVTSIHKSGDVSKETLKKLIATHPQYSAVLFNFFKSKKTRSGGGSSFSWLRTNYTLYDLKTGKKVAQIKAELNANTSLTQNYSKENAKTILNELQTKNIVCCSK